jgi:hypothetical protein
MEKRRLGALARAQKLAEFAAKRGHSLLDLASPGSPRVRR